MLTRFDPFRDMALLQSRMNRMFDDFFGRTEPEATGVEWRPMADVFEDENHIVITLDIPGMKKEDVHISVENNMLSIHGERKLEQPDKQTNYHRIERPLGMFSRSFALPNTVNAGNIQANYRDGVLEVVLPKKEESKPRTIPVQIT